jgi:hypothetical protein
VSRTEAFDDGRGNSSCEYCGGFNDHPTKEFLDREGLEPKRTASELIGAVDFEDHYDLRGRWDDAGGDNNKLMRIKYKEAVESGLKDQVLQNGIQSPIDVHVDEDGNQTVTDGHHRLAVMLKHRPNTPIPIHYWNG